jgi:hypothetical protein
VLGPEWGRWKTASLLLSFQVGTVRPSRAPPNSRPRVRSEGFLEVLFGRPVDPVTENALRPELRPVVEKEAIRV